MHSTYALSDSTDILTLISISIILVDTYMINNQCNILFKVHIISSNLGCTKLEDKIFTLHCFL